MLWRSVFLFKVLLKFSAVGEKSIAQLPKLEKFAQSLLRRVEDLLLPAACGYAELSARATQEQ